MTDAICLIRTKKRKSERWISLDDDHHHAAAAAAVGVLSVRMTLKRVKPTEAPCAYRKRPKKKHEANEHTNTRTPGRSPGNVWSTGCGVGRGHQSIRCKIVRAKRGHRGTEARRNQAREFFCCLDKRWSHVAKKQCEPNQWREPDAVTLCQVQLEKLTRFVVIINSFMKLQ